MSDQYYSPGDPGLHEEARQALDKVIKSAEGLQVDEIYERCYFLLHLKPHETSMVFATAIARLRDQKAKRHV